MNQTYLVSHAYLSSQAYLMGAQSDWDLRSLEAGLAAVGSLPAGPFSWLAVVQNWGFWHHCFVANTDFFSAICAALVFLWNQTIRIVLLSSWAWVSLGYLQYDPVTSLLLYNS